MAEGMIERTVDHELRMQTVVNAARTTPRLGGSCTRPGVQDAKDRTAESVDRSPDRQAADEKARGPQPIGPLNGDDAGVRLPGNADGPGGA